jgi:outer membrane protein TolC
MRCRGSLFLVIWAGAIGLILGLSQTVEPTGAREFPIDQLVDRALRDNLELQAARAEVEAARGRLLQAGLRPNPTLDVGVQQSVTGPDNNVMVGGHPAA